MSKQYVDRARKSQPIFQRRVYLAGISVLVSLLGVSCAPVSYVKPVVGLNFKITPQDEDSTRSGDYIQAESLLQSYSQQDADQVDGLPVFKPVSFVATDYCFVVNVTGSGLGRAFHGEKEKCDMAFPGLGTLSPVFFWNQNPQVEAPFGERRFDVMAFRKETFGGQCPKLLSSVEKESGDEFYADGVKIPFPTGAEAPLLVGSKVIRLEAGLNEIELGVKNLGSRLVADSYGCRSFKVFPQPEENSELLKTGMSQLFFDVECPEEADLVRVSVGKYNPVVSEATCDRSTGRALVVSQELDSYDLKASEWDFRYPYVQVSVWDSETGSKIGSKSFKVKYVSGGSWRSLASVSEQEWTHDLENGDDRFWFGSMDDEQLFVGVENSSDSQIYELGVPRDRLVLKNEKSPLIWSGENAVELMSQNTKDAFSHQSENLSLGLDLKNGIFYPEWKQGAKVYVNQVTAQRVIPFERKNKIILRPQLLSGGVAEILNSYNNTVESRSVLYKSPDNGRHWFRVYLGPVGSEIVDIYVVGGQSSQGAEGFIALERYLKTDAEGHPTTERALRILVQKSSNF